MSNSGLQLVANARRNENFIYAGGYNEETMYGGSMKRSLQNFFRNRVLVVPTLVSL